MKYRYVFVLGRPGCGKSALYGELEKRILESGQAETIERMDDFPKLWARFQADDALEQEGKERIYTKRSAEGAYLITNPRFWNEILKELNADALSINNADHMIFLEFARSSYVEAIQNFDQQVLDHCIAIYMQVNFELCWARNVARFEADRTQDGDDHHVYRETMEEIYLHDDRDAFVRYMRERNIPVSVVNNEAEGEEHLKRLVKELFEDLF